MLDRAKKAEVMNELKSGFENANAVFLTNLIGLTSNDAVELRKNLETLMQKFLLQEIHYLQKLLLVRFVKK